MMNADMRWLGGPNKRVLGVCHSQAMILRLVASHNCLEWQMKTVMVSLTSKSHWNKCYKEIVVNFPK